MKKNLFSIGKKQVRVPIVQGGMGVCLLYTSPSPRD